jgi:competence protein ComEC
MAAPLIPILLAWIAGLLLGERQTFSVGTWLSLSLSVPFAIALAVRRYPPAGPPPLHPPVYMCLVALALVLGGARGQGALSRVDSNNLALYNGQGTVTIRGTIARYPDRRGGTTRYDIEAFQFINKESGERFRVSGRLRASLNPYPQYHYGDAIELTGRLEAPPVFPQFDYRTFLARKGIYSASYRPQVELIARQQGAPLFHRLFLVRERAEHTLQMILPEPHASLMSGILLGIESGIAPPVLDAFTATGTTHVLVISGFNFAILAGLFLFMGRQLFGRTHGSLLALLAIALYALLVGAEPPVVRAALMGSLTIFALLVRREAMALNILAFTVLAMTALRPAYLQEVGFQLSALSTLGLILFVRPMTRVTDRLLSANHWLSLSAPRRARALGLFSDAVLVTLAAQIITLPLIVGTFGRFSTVSLLANLLILPVQTWLLLSGGLATLLGMIWLPLGQMAAAVPLAGLAWTVAVVKRAASLPLASIDTGHIPAFYIWSVYALCGLWWWARGQSFSGLFLPVTSGRGSGGSRFSIRIPQAILWAAVLLIAAGPWVIARNLPDGRLHLYALDVGQGDAILIVTPDGKQILIDGGPNPVSLLAHLGARMPPWDRTIELVVLTHADADHLGGLPELLGRYRVTAVMDSGHGHTTPLYKEWQTGLANEPVTPVVATPGQRWHLGRGAYLEVLAPLGRPFETLNENAVVLRLRYGQFCALFTGDIEAEAEARLVANGALEPCQVLKVAHHGSNTSSSQPFLDAVRPRYALVSAGGGNRFGHPHPDVIARLEAIGTRLFRTDLQGTIHLSTDGRELWVKTER